MSKVIEYQLEEQAERAIEYANSRNWGGSNLNHEKNAYGIALGYVIAVKGMSYGEAGKILGMTSSGVSNMCNRKSEKSFNPVYVDTLCDKFNIDRQYFRDLVGEIRKRVGGR